LITDIRSWPTSKIHLLVTSRWEPDINEKLAPLLTAPAISIEGSGMDGDIKKHIKNQLATDPKLMGWSDDLKAHIKRTLVEKRTECESGLCDNPIQNLTHPLQVPMGVLPTRCIEEVQKTESITRSFKDSPEDFG
jgi:hypothetical protein